MAVTITIIFACFIPFKFYYSKVNGLRRGRLLSPLLINWVPFYRKDSIAQMLLAWWALTFYSVFYTIPALLTFWFFVFCLEKLSWKVIYKQIMLGVLTGWIIYLFYSNLLNWEMHYSYWITIAPLFCDWTGVCFGILLFRYPQKPEPHPGTSDAPEN